MEPINFFNAVKFLEPKCPKCETVLKYDVNTKFDNKLNTHICLKCGSRVE